VSSTADKPTAVEELDHRIRDRLGRIAHRVVVFSGKGGVGKTTVSVNLACALARAGEGVGLLDADVTGPDVPKMLGMQGRARLAPDGRLMPEERDGLKVISFGMLVPEESPVIWRGPLRSRALDQFLGDVAWGNLEYLIADLPPGTGDEVLTMARRMEPQLAVIVTTPQEMSLIDSRRAINMAKKVEIPRIGVVENMAGLQCPECGHRIHIFGSGGGERVAREMDVDFLGSVPMDVRAREEADHGRPITMLAPASDISRALMDLARSIMTILGAGGER
jgi:ATP-binding protein involved in chromosome partitioning